MAGGADDESSSRGSSGPARGSAALTRSGRRRRWPARSGDAPSRSGGNVSAARAPLLGDIVWMEETDGVLAAQLPEEALLGDPLGRPAHRPGLEASEEPGGRVVRVTGSSRPRLRSASASCPRTRCTRRRKKPARGFTVVVVRIVGLLAIELITIRPRPGRERRPSCGRTAGSGGARAAASRPEARAGRPRSRQW